MSPAKQSYKTLSKLPRKAARWGSGHSRGGSKELGAAGYPEVFAAPCCGKTHRQREAVPLPPRCARDAGRGLRVREERHSPSLHPAQPPARHGEASPWLPEMQRGRCSPKEALLQLLLLQNLHAGSAGCSLIRAFRRRRRRIKGSFSPRHDSLEHSLRQGTKTDPRERLAGEGKNYPI